MPSLVEGDDRQTVKRVVPKASNKIQAVAIVKLYVAYPNRSRWTYTGLQGAAVLADDLVGHTYWIKLVDVSPSNRGVIWDQEIYDTFQYNQDRVFFHSFELEDCMAGFSFADDKEARKFKEKMDAREKNAHKNTRTRPFGNGAGTSSAATNGEHHGRLGKFGNLLHRDRASSSASAQPAQSIIPPKEISIARAPKEDAFENIDPQLLAELQKLGLNKDQLAENADFIKMYIEQNAASNNTQRARPPPPPAPISPQDTGTSRRGPAPAPPPARRSGPAPPTPDSPVRRTPSPPAGPRFRAPPPLADAGKFAQDVHVGRSRAQSNVAHPGPPPPPRPPKTPMDDDGDGPKFGVPPPFQGERVVPAPPPRGAGGSAPPPPPARGPVPPPPPARDHAGPVHMVPPAAALSAPPLPPKTPNAPITSATGPPPPPARDARAVPPPVSAGLPPPPPSRGSVLPPPPPMPSSSNGPPPPPPMPSASNGPPPPPPMPSSSSGPPPPPPMPSSSGPPPPPPPMPGAGSDAPALPKPPPGVSGLLGEIRGGAKLKKVSDTEKRDRSAAMVPGGAASAPAPGGAPAPPGGDQGGLAGALASALAARKSKVSQSDDEDDKDDW